jgi:hypothetical protein
LRQIIAFKLVIGFIGPQVLEGDIDWHSQVLQIVVELWDLRGIEDEDVALSSRLHVLLDPHAGVLGDERVDLIRDGVVDDAWDARC